MARGSNFYYQDPTAEIGSSLARAIVGDRGSAARQQQLQAEAALRDAQAREAASHGTYYEEQARGARIGNDAADTLPALIAKMYSPSATAGPAPAQEAPATFAKGYSSQAVRGPAGIDAGGAAPADPSPQPMSTVAGPGAQGGQFDPGAFRAGLPGLIARMAQMQGHDVKLQELVGTLAGLFGNDAIARGGLIAQGKTPGKEFAIDSARADQIAAAEAAAKEHEGVAVATVNHASDIPTANIQAGATLGSARIHAGATLGAAQIGAGASEYDTRYRVDHGGKPGKTPPVKMINTAGLIAIGQQVDETLRQRGAAAYDVPNPTGPATRHYGDPATRQMLMASAVQHYQQSGNPVAAARDAYDQAAAVHRAKHAAPAAPAPDAPQPVRLSAAPARAAPKQQPIDMSAAKRAPNGSLYVPIGKGPDGKIQWGKVQE